MEPWLEREWRAQNAADAIPATDAKFLRKFSRIGT